MNRRSVADNNSRHISQYETIMLILAELYQSLYRNLRLYRKFQRMNVLFIAFRIPRQYSELHIFSITNLQQNCENSFMKNVLYYEFWSYLYKAPLMKNNKKKLTQCKMVCFFGSQILWSKGFIVKDLQVSQK